MEEIAGTPPAVSGGEPAKVESAPPAPATATPDDASLLKARLEEKDSFIGRQANELGSLRNEVGYLRSLVEQAQARSQEPVESVPATPTRTKINWDNPDESIDRLVEEKFQARERAREQSDRARRAQVAQANFESAFEQAKRENPKLFEGIDKEVQYAVQNTFQSGLINEYNITPKTVKRAAQLIWLEKDSPDRIVPSSPTPVRPTATETPVARPISTEDVSVEIDEETRKWGREQGLNDKQIDELVGNELQAVAKGLNKSAFRR